MVRDLSTGGAMLEGICGRSARGSGDVLPTVDRLVAAMHGESLIGAHRAMSGEIDLARRAIAIRDPMTAWH